MRLSSGCKPSFACERVIVRTTTSAVLQQQISGKGMTNKNNVPLVQTLLCDLLHRVEFENLYTQSRVKQGKKCMRI